MFTRLGIQFAIKCLVFVSILPSSSTYGQAHSWTPAEGTFGWDVGGIDIVRTQPGTLYLVALGLARSTDFGQTWFTISGYGSNVGRVRTHPENPLIIHVLLHFQWAYHDRSTDGGYTWTFLYLYPDYSGRILNFDPVEPDVLYAGSGPRVLRSFDGGATWTDTLAYPPVANIGWLSTLAIHPMNRNLLYLGCSLGLFKSTDRGVSWIHLPAYTPTEHTIMNVVVDPRDTSVVYAGIFGGNVSQGTIKKSTDGGATWFEITSGLSPMNRKVNILTLNPSNPSELFAGMWHQGGDPIYRSTNGGESWESYSNGLASMTISAIEFDTMYHRIYVGGWALPGAQGVHFMDRSTSVQVSDQQIPARISLTVYPNPFNSTTKLRFSLPNAAPVRLRVFDLLGREVLPAMEGERYDAGEHEMEIDASGLASGVYVVSLQAGSRTLTAKLLLAR